MATKILQQRFTQGEFSPELLGRSDIDQYYSGAESLNNVNVIPQGGLKRRGGTRHITPLIQKLNTLAPSSVTAPNGGTTSSIHDAYSPSALLTTASVSTTNPYVVATFDLGADVAINYVCVSGVKLTVSGTSTGDFFIEVATAAAPTTWFTTNAINLTTTATAAIKAIGGTFQHVRFVKTTATDLGTNKISIDEMFVLGTTTTTTNVRQMPFEFNRTQAYNVVFTDRLLTIFKDTTLVAYIPHAMFTSERILEINWTQSADTAIIVHEDIPPHSLTRGATDADWEFKPITFEYIPKYDYVPTSSNPAGTITPSATTGVVTLTASGTPFTDSTDVGKIVDGGGGRARVLQFLTTSTVKAIVLIPFYANTAITSGAWVYEAGYEDVWSSTRKWPKSVTFHYGRLWFGGSGSRPQTLWASRVGLFFDFDPGQIYDDDAIDVTLDTDQVNGIVNLLSKNSLQVFTTGGEFTTSQSAGVAITPSNIDIRRQTQEGSQLGIRPVEIDGSTIYVKFNGSSIIRFIFDDLQSAYSSTSISVLSSHLIKTPVDMAADKTNNDNDASLLYVVNSDGTMAVGSILESQKVIAFVEYDTDINHTTAGEFKSVSVTEDGTFVVIQRTITAGDTLVYEELDEAYLMDGGFKATGAISSVTGVTWLEGRTVKLRVDGVNVADVVVTSGVVTVSPSSTTSIEFGVNFTTEIKDLPVEISTQTVRAQTTTGKKKRVSGVELRLKSSSGIKVNGNEVTTPIFTSDGAGSNTAISNFTGVIRVDGISNYTDTGQLTIAQAEPNPLTLLAVTKKVNF